jgi:polyferredoxin
VKMDVMRDRASLAREVDGGRVENVYRIQLMNTAEAAGRFTLAASDRNGKPLEVIADAQPLEVPPLTTRMFTVRVRADPSARGSEAIEFVLDAKLGDEKSGDTKSVAIREKSRFLFP